MAHKHIIANRKNVHIYEYNPTTIAARTFIVDDSWRAIFSPVFIHNELKVFGDHVSGDGIILHVIPLLRTIGHSRLKKQIIPIE